MRHDDDDWAVFWCSLLGPILLEDVPAGERRRFLLNLSQQQVQLPDGKRKRISLSTLRREGAPVPRAEDCRAAAQAA